MSSVIRNTTLMLVGSIGQKIISLAYFAFLVRMLGKELTGEYTAALALSTLFVVFIDIGLTNILIRNGAQEKDKLSQWVSNIFGIKIITAGAAYSALLIFSWTKFEAPFILLVAVSGVTMILDTIHLTLYGYLRAIGELRYEAIGMVMSQFITLVLGTIFLLLHWPLVSLMVAFTVASFVNVLYSHFHAAKHGLRLMRPEPSGKLWLLAWSALPFTLAIMFGRFYSYVDVVLLKLMRDSAEVGIYSTPSKISFAFQFIPLAFTAALYPRLSELAKRDPAKFREALTHGIHYLLLISVPLSFGIFALAEPITVFVFSEKFIESVVPLKILILSLIFSFVSFPIGAALNACGGEKRQTLITGVALLINIIGNAILIPRHGAVGAAWSALIGNCILGAGFLLLPLNYRAYGSSLLKSMAQISFATVLMYAATVYVQARWDILPLSIMIGAMVFMATAVATKLISRNDLNYLKQALRTRPATDIV